ncbi:hypothetical protein BN13_10032 [Nostocoides jenkinsii Ben 74]|uniref:Luciferase-like domain-containing protein n=1 Tax=Nostocoides jenkinsii Ben 74 TaxID=1193518 RepID=A0A077M409_9MICO|nr:hypothetical protein BN13_10032 [Tetrasphaera jenkinsii Ben 74]
MHLLCDTYGAQRIWQTEHERSAAKGPAAKLGLGIGYWGTAPDPDLADRIALHPARPTIPILLAAQGPKNVALSAEIADGWIPAWFSPYASAEAERALADGFAKREVRGGSGALSGRAQGRGHGRNPGVPHRKDRFGRSEGEDPRRPRRLAGVARDDPACGWHSRDTARDRRRLGVRLTSTTRAYYDAGFLGRRASWDDGLTGTT